MTGGRRILPVGPLHLRRPVELEIVCEAEGFRALESVWNPLLERSGANTIFLTFEWLWTWWRHFGHRHVLRLVVVRRGRDVVALAPFMITRREGLRQLGTIGNKISDYKDFIIDDREDREKVIRGIFDLLLGTPGWDFLMLNGVSEDSVNYSALEAVCSSLSMHETFFVDANSSPYIPVEGSWSTYFNSLKRSFRKDALRTQKKLESRTESHFYTEETNGRSIGDLIDQIIDMNAEKYKEDRSLISVFDNSLTRSFYKDFANLVSPLGWLRIPALYIDGELASMFLDFQYDNKYFGIITGYNKKFSGFSPGRLLELRQIRKSFEQGLSEYDMLGGNESYKFDYNPRARKMYTVYLFQRSIRGRLACRWVAGLRPVVERFFERRLHKYYWQIRKKALKKG